MPKFGRSVPLTDARFFCWLDREGLDGVRPHHVMSASDSDSQPENAVP